MCRLTNLASSHRGVYLYTPCGENTVNEQDYIAANRELWDNWTIAHVEQGLYDVAGFKAGRNSLTAVELEEMGEVSGKSLLHLQCHFGMDTLSWGRLGAVVTGADFSEKAIAAAQQLAAEIGIPAQFVCANLYDLPPVLDAQFDIVYTAIGAIFWLPNLERWAQVVDHFLKPGGFFYIHELHPFPMIFEDDTGKLEISHPYFHQPEPLSFDTDGSYAGAFDYKGKEYGWIHSMSDIINALLKVGLRLDFFHEFPFAYDQRFVGMERDKAGRYTMPNHNLPFTFSLRASKP